MFNLDTTGLSNEDVRELVNNMTLTGRCGMQRPDTDEVLGELADYGFRLYEPDDHVLELFHKGVLVARFSQLGTTPEAIRNTCREYLKRAI